VIVGSGGKMRPRRHFNPKRRIDETSGPLELAPLADRVRYTGSPYHKRKPGDFGLTPPSQPRPDKTLCDMVGITSKLEAWRLLRNGVRKGLISVQRRGEFPQNIWSVTQDGIPLEAMLEDRVQGTYHGYPLASHDDFGDEVLERWNRS
jgi:hypothetical protein